MGSSSDRNCEARKRVPTGAMDQRIYQESIKRFDVPVDGLSPNCTICLKLTPVAGNDE